MCRIKQTHLPLLTVKQDYPAERGQEKENAGV